MDILDLKNPRQIMEKAVNDGDLEKLLRITGLLHGHYCPGSAMGVKAAARAVKELKVKSTGMEETIAIVEINNCFSDGVQMVTGCSFGNNGLIYRDYGKMALTLAKRTGEGIRITATFDRARQERSSEVSELWEKVVAKRQGSEEESRKLTDLWIDYSFRVLKIPDEEILRIQKVKIHVPSYARVFDSAKCSLCGENFIETRSRLKDGKVVCLPCSGQAYYQLAGDGITASS
jgi:formylmethanofuran dehydrogenase subunit E